MHANQNIQVVVAYDFTRSAEWALARAVDAAVRAPQHVLHIVAVLDAHERIPVLATGQPLDYETADRVREFLAQHVREAFAGREAAEVQFYLHVRIGKAATEILDLAGEVGAGLIFVGSRGWSRVHRWLLGSVCERIVREARCAVVVARESTYEHVDLERVEFYDHPREPHHEPHTYSASNRQGITRPNEWPIP